MITRLRAPATWTKQWGPGIALANLYALYDSAGDVTISAETSLPSVLNGPGVVHRFGALTVTTLLHAAVNRCRHAVLLCDSLTMGAAGEISMSGRGAAGHAGLVDQDLVIPSAINFSGKHTSFAAFCAWLRANKYSIFDPNLYASPLPGMGDVLADYAAWPGAGATPIITAAGCGAGGAGTAAGSLAPPAGRASTSPMDSPVRRAPQVPEGAAAGPPMRMTTPVSPTTAAGAARAESGAAASVVWAASAWPGVWRPRARMPIRTARGRRSRVACSSS